MAPRTFLPARPTTTMRLLYWVLVFAITVGTGFTAVLFLPQPELGYRVTADALHVDAQLGVIDLGRTFPLAAIDEARVVEVGDAWRFNGTGAPSLCEGGWHSEATGDAWFATTCGAEAVMLSGEHITRPLVLTPDDAPAFISAVQSGTPGVFAPADPGPPPPWWALVRYGPLVLAVGLAALFVGSPLLLRFEVGGGELAVRTMWGRRRVPLSGATFVAKDEGRAAMRLFGVGMPGHQMGRYRKNGRFVQVYLTRRENSVRIAPTEGVHVVVSPEDVAGFTAALEADGARPATVS
jgi:hypothetical protein